MIATTAMLSGVEHVGTIPITRETRSMGSYTCLEGKRVLVYRNRHVERIVISVRISNTDFLMLRLS